MSHNIFLKREGEIIHDALRDFSKVSDGEHILPNLEGGCAIGSFFLMKEAHRRGIDATFRGQNNHCWLESEGYIYDITACQFTHKKGSELSDEVMNKTTKVHIIPVHEKHNVSWGRFYRETSWYPAYLTSEETIARINEKWPVSQQPQNYCIERHDGKARIFLANKKWLKFFAG